jgi:hypothetical protein
VIIKRNIIYTYTDLAQIYVLVAILVGNSESYRPKTK